MTDLEGLKNEWQSGDGIPEDRFQAIASKVRRSSDRFSSTIFRRDMRETLAAILVLLFFLPGLFAAKNWILWSGFAVTVVAALTIPVVLWRARRTAAAPAASFIEFLNVEIELLRRQVRLLAMVTWWYLLPLFVGIVLIVVGSMAPRPETAEVVFLLVFLPVCVALFAWIWWLNQTARRKHLGPLLDYYERLRTAIASSDPLVSSLPDPPTDFLHASRARKPLSKRQRWIWMVVIVLVTSHVAIAGTMIMRRFDARTGGFIIAAAPVVAVLLVFLSGIYRFGFSQQPIETEEESEAR